MVRSSVLLLLLGVGGSMIAMEQEQKDQKSKDIAEWLEITVEQTQFDPAASLVSDNEKERETKITEFMKALQFGNEDIVIQDAVYKALMVLTAEDFSKLITKITTTDQTFVQKRANTIQQSMKLLRYYGHYYMKQYDKCNNDRTEEKATYEMSIKQFEKDRGKIAKLCLGTAAGWGFAFVFGLWVLFTSIPS